MYEYPLSVSGPRPADAEQQGASLVALGLGFLNSVEGVVCPMPTHPARFDAGGTTPRGHACCWQRGRVWLEAEGLAWLGVPGPQH